MTGRIEPVRPTHRDGGRVAIVRLDNLGDVLLAGPAVRAVAARAEEVTFICGPGGRAAAELLPGVDHIVAFDAAWVPLDARSLDRGRVDAFLEEVAQAGLDAAIVLTSFHQSPLPMALLLKMAGVSCVAASSVDHPGSLLDIRVRPDEQDDRHEVQRALQLAALAGYPLSPTDTGRLALRRPLPRPALPAGFNPSAYTVVHPGASVPARAVPRDRARALVAALADRGEPVIVTGSPAETDLVDHVAADRTEVLRCTDASLSELAGLIDQAGVVVCGNTGPAHLAAAVRTPVVSVFAPVVSPRRWAPWQVDSSVLGDHAIGCRDCRCRMCPFPGQPCLDAVTPDALLDEVTRWLDRSRNRTDHLSRREPVR